MFFLNQDLKFIILDLESIEDHESCLSALNANADKFEHLYVLDRRGGRVLTPYLNSRLPNLINRITVYPDEADTFGWLLIPINDFFIAKNISPLDSLFISQSEDNLQCAHSTPIGSLTISSNPTPQFAKVGADLIVDSWNDLNITLSGKFLGYLGEVQVVPARSLFIRSQQDSVGNLVKMKNDHLPQVPIYYGGRYFNSKDMASSRHLYTQRLKWAKSNPLIASPSVTHVLKSLLDYIKKEEAIAPTVTYVPPKPTSASDHLGILLSDFSSKHTAVTSLLRCIKDYPPQKDAGSFSDRAANVRGAFQIINPPQIRNLDIVLIDDIGTSFSTVNECARVLLSAGANKVVILCLSITCIQSNVILPKLQCSKCGSALKIRFNSKKGNPFWGCTGYKKGEPHDVLDFVPGVVGLRKLDRSTTSEIPF